MNDRKTTEDYARPIRIIFMGIAVLFLFSSFLLWKIDNPRAERIRIAAISKVFPSLEWVLLPMKAGFKLIQKVQSFNSLYAEKEELILELKKMKTWQEAAIQLKEENARLLDLNNVRLNPSLTYITGLVLTDSGSPFRRSLLLNVGSSDGIKDGWSVVDGEGLIGRIFGVGPELSRVVLVIDSSSRIPVTIEPSGQKALLAGDSSLFPTLEIIENIDLIRAGDRVVTSGDGKLFPSDVLVGQIVRSPEAGLRVKLAADYSRLEFLKVIRAPEINSSGLTGEIITNTEPATVGGAADG